MNTAQIKQLGNTVGFVLAMNRPDVIRLLKANGTPVSSQSSDNSLRSATIDQIIENQKFNKAFDKLAKTSAKQFLKATKQNPSASADGGGGFDWGGMTSGILGAGTAIFGQISASNAQKKLAEQEAKTAQLNAQTAIAQANAQLEIERIRLQQIQAQNAGGTDDNNTMLYVGIGLVALLIIGGVIVIAKK